METNSDSLRLIESTLRFTETHRDSLHIAQGLLHEIHRPVNNVETNSDSLRFTETHRDSLHKGS